MKQTTISVADYGITPNTGEDCTTLLKRILSEIKNIETATTLIFPKGEYHFYKEFGEQRQYHLSNTDSLDYPLKTIGILIEEQSNLTINGQGSLFIFHGDFMAFALVNCKNVKLQDFSIDYQNPPTTEMVIDKVEGNKITYGIPASQTFTIEGHSIFWYENSPIDGSTYWKYQNDYKCVNVMVYEPHQNRIARHELEDSPFYRVNSLKEVFHESNDQMRFVEVEYGTPRPDFYEKGVRFEFSRNKFRDTSGVFIWQCENVKMNQLNVHFLYSFGWLSQMCKDITFSDCRFESRKESGRLCSSSADLIHITGCAGKVLIENCYFTHAHDDAINIHGAYVQIEKLLDSNSLVAFYAHGQQGGFPQFYPNDKVRICRRDSLRPVAELTVSKSIHPDQFDGRRMEIMFFESLPTELANSSFDEVGYVIENISYTPQVEIRDCEFEMIPTRGILCTTKEQALITGNTFKSITMAAVYLSGDSEFWYEAGAIDDMTIKNNKFAPSSYWEGKKSAPIIFVEPITVSGPEDDLAIHQNIRIIENHFATTPEESIVALRVANLEVVDNTFVDD